MLEFGDASEALDLRIGEALARWTGTPTESPSFTRTGKGIAGLRLLLEASAGEEGVVRRTLREGVSVFSFTCQRKADERTVEGIGESVNLAICDAFLACDPEYFSTIGPPLRPSSTTPRFR